MKKRKKNCLGINWYGVFMIIIFPIMTVITLIIGCNLLFNFAKDKYQEYLLIESSKFESESIEESIMLESESIQASIAQSIALESERRESMAKENMEQRLLQIKFEDNVIKKKVPYGTWVRNKDNLIVGKVISYQGKRIFTNTEYWFDLDDNLSYPDNIEEIGLKDYLEGLNNLQKSKDRELREMALKLKKEEVLEDTKYTESLFTIINGYNKHYFKCNGKYYKVKKINGLEIITTDGKIFNSKIDKIEEVGWIEYDRRKK